jgi:3-carboxy-cis,cis-muconate cycloisomerase
MRPSSSGSELFGAVLARGGAAEAVSDRAWLDAMLAFEAGLARAQADAGVISEADANAVADACAQPLDPAEIGRDAGEIGNPAGPLVKALKARTDAPVHLGATSQDVVDTAAMLVTREALRAIAGDLDGAGRAAERLAREHRDTPTIGRTLLQQAVPTTFGLKAAGWMTGLDEARDGLARVRLSVQLGGAAGTLAAMGEPGPQVLARLARELELEPPVLPWHTLRGRIGELAGALGVAAGAVAKPARDITLLAQTEVGEVREASPGGSTAMPHKQNPVAAIAALGCALPAPQLVAALLSSMVQEHERAAGAWHAEWRPLCDLLVAVGSAAAWLRTSLEGLRVDVERMRANLGEDADVGCAGVFVDRALEAVA